MGGGPSGESDAGIPTSREEYEEAVGINKAETEIDTSEKDYSTSSGAGADDDYEEGDFESVFSGDYEDDAFDDFPDVGGTSGGGSYKDDIPDSEKDEQGWQPGDRVPNPGTFNYSTGQYTVDGNVVTKEEYDANQRAREQFLEVATDNTNKNYKDAYAEEMMRSDNRNPNDDGYQEDYETYKNQAEDYFADNQVTNAKLNEVMNSPTYQKLNYSTQEAIKTGLASNNKQMQIEAIRAVGEYFGDSRRQDNLQSRQMLGQLFGGQANINQMQGYGKLTGSEYAQALVDGFNQGSGFDLPGLGTGFDLPGEMFDFDGLKMAQGIGGTKMSIDAQGNISVQSPGNNLASGIANTAIGLGSTKLGPTGSLLASGINVGLGKIGLNDYLGTSGLMGTKKNSLNYNPGSVLTSAVTGQVMKGLGPKVAERVFMESDGNVGLTKGALAATQLTAQDAIKNVVESLDMGQIDLLGGGSNNTPKGGGNVKANVNTGSSGETSSVQSDLASGSGVSPDAAGETQLSQNLKSSQQSSGGGDNDGGSNDDAARDFLKAMPETLDVNTLQNLNPTNTTPLTTMNNDASLMMNAIGNTFGGRYLQRGRNRDTGSVTTKRATQRDVDKDRRRSGILFG